MTRRINEYTCLSTWIRVVTPKAPVFTSLNILPSRQLHSSKGSDTQSTSSASLTSIWSQLYEFFFSRKKNSKKDSTNNLHALSICKTHSQPTVSFSRPHLKFSRMAVLHSFLEAHQSLHRCLFSNFGKKQKLYIFLFV